MKRELYIHYAVACLGAALVLFLMGASLHAQEAALPKDSPKDSLQMMRNKGKLSAKDYQKLCNWGRKWAIKYPKESPKALDIGLNGAKRDGLDSVYCSCMQYKANIFFAYAKYDSAYRVYEAMYKHPYVQNQNLKYKAQALLQMGNSQWVMGDLPKALELMLKSLRLNEQQKNGASIAECHLFIGNIYDDLGQPEKALEHYQKCYEIAKGLEDKDAKYFMSRSLHNRVTTLFRLDRISESAQAQKEAIVLFKELGDDLSVAQGSLNLASLDFDPQNPQKSIDLLLSSIEIFKKYQETLSLSSAYNELAQIYFGFYKDYARARSYSLKSEETLEGVESTIARMSIYSKRAQIDSASGNMTQALASYKMYIVYRDSLNNQEKAMEVGRLEAEHEAEKEIAVLEKDKALQQAEINQRNFLLAGVISVLLLLIGIAVLLFRARKRSERDNQRLADLNSTLEQQKEEIRQQRDELSQTNDKLHELDLFKQNMMGMVVHDLKNPLNAVLMVSAGAEHRSPLGLIRRAGMRMLQLVENLLDIQKYEDNKLSIETRAISVQELISESTEQVKLLLDEKNLRIDCQTEAHLAVLADAPLITRVLVNLLTNAIKFAPNGDTLQLTAEDNIGHSGASEQIRFTVTDHGAGIPADMHELVFEKFAQAKALSSGRTRSTGLGLTFCRMVVEAHGGNIGVESEQGVFTRFSFTLPRAMAITGSVPSKDQAISVVQAFPMATVQEDAKHILLPVLAKLQTLEVYQISDVLDVLGTVDTDMHPELARWRDALEQASFANDEMRYNNLLKVAEVA